MIDSYMCVDTGNSGTKIVYSFPETGKIHSLLMSSALAEVSLERMQNKLSRSNWIGQSRPEQEAWLRNGNEIVAVGEFAEEFDPIDCRTKPKYENALYKILAAIGVIIQTHRVSKRKQFKIQLGLLLPWDEYKTQKLLVEELKRLLSEFEFRGQKIRVKIRDCICYPEGGGIASSRIKQEQADWLKKQRLGILMLGDRNCTALYFERGKLKDGASPLIGFSFLLDQIIKDTPYLLSQDKSRENLSSAIFQGIDLAKRWTTKSDKSGRPLWQEIPSIKNLATARNENLRKAEVEDIDKAITAYSIEWEQKLSKLIQEVFPDSLTELNVGGGALLFYAPFIKEYFNYDFAPSVNSNPAPINYGSKGYTPIVNSAGMVEKVAKTLNLGSKVDAELALPIRFVDVCCLIQSLIDDGERLSQQKQNQKKRKKAAAVSVGE